MSVKRKTEKGRRAVRSFSDALGALLTVLTVMTLAALLIRKGAWKEDRSGIVLSVSVFLSNLIFALRKGRGEAKGAVFAGVIQSAGFLIMLCICSAAAGKGIMEPVKNTPITVACAVGVAFGKVTNLYKSNKNINSGIRTRKNITKRNHA